MKDIGPITYQDHLNLLAMHPQKSASDYGMYLREQQMARSFYELSSTLIFLLDFATKHYPLIGHNAKQVVGHPMEAFYEGGLEFMLHQYRDFEILNKRIFPDEAQILKGSPVENVSKLRFSKSYRFKDQNGVQRTILQRHTAICDPEKKLPLVIFGFATEITNFTEKGKIIHQVDRLDENTGNWGLLLSKEYYPDIDQNKLLSERELEILKWAVEGLGSKQIADKLNIAFNTVNTHRRNMLRKTNSKNSVELLRYATENKLL